MLVPTWLFINVQDCKTVMGMFVNCLILNFDGLLSDVACQLYFSFNVAACEITTSEASTAQPSTVTMTTPGKLRRQERFPGLAIIKFRCSYICEIIIGFHVITVVH